jgi:hypothetical protein
LNLIHTDIFQNTPDNLTQISDKPDGFKAKLQLNSFIISYLLNPLEDVLQIVVELLLLLGDGDG